MSFAQGGKFAPVRLGNESAFPFGLFFRAFQFRGRLCRRDPGFFRRGSARFRFGETLLQCGKFRFSGGVFRTQGDKAEDSAGQNSENEKYNLHNLSLLF